MTLLKAAEKGDVEALRALLAGGAPVDPAPAGEDSPLAMAAMYGHVEAARVLLDAGANINHRCQYGRTALHYAASRSLALTELLLERGPDLRVRHDGDHDVLEEHLTHEADPEIISRLIAAGFDLSMRPQKYRKNSSHLMWACFCGRAPAVERLLAAGVDPNEGDPLGEALSNGSIRERVAAVLAALVKGGIDANFVSKRHGLSILMAVCEQGDLATAQLLLDRGADPNARLDGTPLTKAEASGNQVLVDLLLERGAKPERAPLPADLLAAREEAEDLPSDAAARLAWAAVLARQGYRAAAASEVLAARDLGADTVPAELLRALELENPAGTKWTIEVAARPDGVTKAIDDARFPGARVTSGARVLPLVIVLGPPCTQCDEQGETVCSDCDGSGTRSGFFNADHEYPCPPRQRCTSCAGLKYQVNSSRFGKGSCAHPEKVVLELDVLGSQLGRCPTCGLAALSSGGYWVDMFACGVCGLFACRCPRQ